ncbi:MAG: hypothetical protein GY943_28525, partial [Chloroflexi bacterium]|nr:hypothetical protein [Chloroflexota bacterium]
VYANTYGTMVRPPENGLVVARERYIIDRPEEMQVMVAPETRVIEATAVSPQRPIYHQLASGLIGIAVGLLLAFLNTLRRKE